MAKNIAAVGSPYIELYVKILFFTVFLYIGYHIVTSVISIMKGGCKTHCRALVQEGFTTYSDSKLYFDTLSNKCDSINDKISTLLSNIDSLEINFGGLKRDICYVTKQVDEGLQGNYASNVPEEERSFPPDEQNKRADQRKMDSVKYVTNLKKTFTEVHNKVPLLECFENENDGMTEEEREQLKIIRENLHLKIDDVKSNLDQFDVSLLHLQKEFANEKLQQYYATLNYNDKYIKQMMTAVAKAKEGFANDDSEEVLNFKPPKEKFIELDPLAGPEQRVNMLEQHFKKSEAMFNTLSKTFTKYNNTTKQQTAILKNAKKVATDEDEQKLQMNLASSKVVKSA